MNNMLIAILLTDVFLIRVFEEITKSHKDQFEFKIIENENEITNYNVIITDAINLNKLKDHVNESHKILCIGENSNFVGITNIKSEISFLKVPFKYSELKKRAENLFTYIKLEKTKFKKFKCFNYDNQNRLILRDNKSLRVTEKENEIFNFLISQNDEYVSRERLLSEIWNYNNEIDTHTLETHLYSLRKKIDEELQLKDLIIYKEKKGYVINRDFL